MSRYIEAEFEIDHYTSMTTHPTPDVSEKDKRDSLIILEALRRAKSIDIVRCKECMFSKVYQNDSSGVMGRFCEAFTQVRMVSDDDFCSYGERKGE